MIKKKVLNSNFLTEDAQQLLKGKFGIYVVDSKKKLNFEPCKENFLKDALNSNNKIIFIPNDGKHRYSVNFLINKKDIKLSFKEIKNK